RRSAKAFPRSSNASQCGGTKSNRATISAQIRTLVGVMPVSSAASRPGSLLEYRPPRSAESEVVSGLNCELGRRTVFELATVCGSNCPAPALSRIVDNRNAKPRVGGAAPLFGVSQLSSITAALAEYAAHGSDQGRLSFSGNVLLSRRLIRWLPYRRGC